MSFYYVTKDLNWLKSYPRYHSKVYFKIDNENKWNQQLVSEFGGEALSSDSSNSYLICNFNDTSLTPGLLVKQERY